MRVERSEERNVVFCYGEPLRATNAIELLIIYLWKQGSEVVLYPKSHAHLFQIDRNQKCPDHAGHISEDTVKTFVTTSKVTPVQLHFPEGGL